MTAITSVSGLALLAGLWSWLLHPPPTETPKAPASWSTVEVMQARSAIRRALPLLVRDGVAWFEGRTLVQDGDGCVSCHQVPFGVWGLQEAARAGLTAEDGTADLTRRALEFVKQSRVARTMSWGPLVLAMHAEASSTDGFARFLLENQTDEGYWEARGQFPGQRRAIEETNAIATMWTLIALSEAAAVNQAEFADPELDGGIDRAVRWVNEAGRGASTEWLLLESLLEDRFGDPPIDTARRELIEQQNQDGGWGWLPGEESNPLSTGQVLYALRTGSRLSRDPERASTERAVRYLLASQKEDGFWEMSSALTSRESSADKDYIYGYWATAWATIGLAHSLEWPPDEAT